MYIRLMYPTEGKKIAELLRLSVHTLCTKDYDSKELEAWVPEKMDMQKFNSSLRRSRNWVMAGETGLLGFICVEKDGYVNRLYVHPEYTGKGVGSALLKTAEDWARRRGIKRMRLASSKTGFGFYKKMGYSVADVEVVEKKGIVFKNKIMEKRL